MIGAVPLALLAALAAGIAVASAAESVLVVRVPVVGYRLHATLSPVGSATDSGRFDALLVRTGRGTIPVSGAPRVPAPPIACTPSLRMGIPCRIGPVGQFPPFPIPPTGVHWTLVWRLALTGITGPVNATVQIGTRGSVSQLLATLCTSCQSSAKGHLSVTASQARLLLTRQSYVDVQAATGELSGRIVVVNWFATTSPVRR